MTARVGQWQAQHSVTRGGNVSHREAPTFPARGAIVIFFSEVGRFMAQLPALGGFPMGEAACFDIMGHCFVLC